MNRDFAEMLRELSAAGAEFLIVGAHALAVHGHVRATKDLDIWIRPTTANAEKDWRALVSFGAPLDEPTVADLSLPGIVFQIGVDPVRIDLLTSISGVEFDDAWPATTLVEQEGIPFAVLGREDLIRAKRAAGRPQDLIDADVLERDTGK